MCLRFANLPVSPFTLFLIFILLVLIFSEDQGEELPGTDKTGS